MVSAREGEIERKTNESGVVVCPGRGRGRGRGASRSLK